MPTTLRLRIPMAVMLSVALASHSATAQDVQYRSITSLDMGMGLNFALKMAGASEVSQTSYIKGKKMRTNSDKSASIFDMERSRIIIINDADKTYIAAPLSEMLAAYREMAASTDVRAEQGQMKATTRDSAGNKMDFTFKVKMDPTSEHQSVNGQDAQRAFATIETDMAITPQGEAKSTDAGTLVILIDSWNAKGGPAYTAVRNFQRAMSKEMRDQAFAGSRGLGAAFAQNPQLGEAMKKASAEQKNMDGMAMKSTMYFVVVPPTLPFDREAAIKPPEAGAGGMAKRAMGGLMGGLLRGRQADKPAPGELKQSTLMKMTTEIRDVQTATLPASLFEVPAGYREIPFTKPTRK